MDKVDEIIYGALIGLDRPTDHLPDSDVIKFGICRKLLSMRRGGQASNADVRELEIYEALRMYRSLYIDKCGLTTIDHKPLIRQLVAAGLFHGLETATELLATAIDKQAELFNHEPLAVRNMRLRPTFFFRIFMAERLLYCASFLMQDRSSEAAHGLLVACAESLSLYVREADLRPEETKLIRRVSESLRNSARCLTSRSTPCDPVQRLKRAARALLPTGTFTEQSVHTAHYPTFERNPFYYRT